MSGLVDVHVKTARAMNRLTKIVSKLGLGDEGLPERDREQTNTRLVLDVQDAVEEMINELEVVVKEMREFQRKHSIK